ncbi:MAG: DUF2062 domain-containing protein [bacterium]|nr:DUF2062 domain-containing protein [bacterium]
MKGPWKVFKDKLNQHIIKPILESHAPIPEAALGAAVGMFLGMTPTVGIQMSLVFGSWLVFKYLLRRKFDLVISTAMVWLSNPVTMGPLYYGFLVTGNWFFAVVGANEGVMSYQEFTKRLEEITHAQGASSWDMFKEGIGFLILDLGYPMVIGSLFWAIPLSILAYLFTQRYLTTHRQRKAEHLGLSYDQWRDKYERSA